MNKIILLSLVLFVLVFSCTEKTDEVPKSDKYQAIDNTQMVSEVSNNGWTVHKSVPPGDTLVVKYTDEMSMATHEVLCNVVWEHTEENQYKLTAPWLDAGVVILQGNLLSMNITKK